MFFFKKRHYEQHRNNYSVPHKIRPVQEKIEIVLIFSIFLIWILNIYSNSAKISKTLVYDTYVNIDEKLQVNISIYTALLLKANN